MKVLVVLPLLVAAASAKWFDFDFDFSRWIDMFNDIVDTGLEERIFSDYFSGGKKYADIITDKKTGNIIDCYIVGDRDYIRFLIGDTTPVKRAGVRASPMRKLMGKSPQLPVINVTSEEMDEFINLCYHNMTKDDRPFHKQLLTKLNPKNIAKLIGQYAFIFPGTKWCGDGDVASKYDDLGPAEATDRCCRDHDHALDNIPKGGERHGIHNDLFYTMSHCDADLQFNKCLVKADTVHASTVGLIYFNILKSRCFDFRPPATCVKRLMKVGPCLNYTYDETKPNTWQIFDPVTYIPGSSVSGQKLNEWLHNIPGIPDFFTGS